MNPRQVKQAMRKLGIKTEELQDVTDVVIRTKTKQYVIKDAAVTIMEMQGQKTFQIVGEPHERRTAAPTFTDEDVQMVMEKTGKTEEEARNALSEVNGDIAEAILRLS